MQLIRFLLQYICSTVTVELVQFVSSFTFSFFSIITILSVCHTIFAFSSHYFGGEFYSLFTLFDREKTLSMAQYICINYELNKREEWRNIPLKSVWIMDDAHYSNKLLKMKFTHIEKIFGRNYMMCFHFTLAGKSYLPLCFEKWERKFDCFTIPSRKTDLS